MTTLIKRAEEFDPLFEEANALPPVWIGPHVGLRLVECFETLRALPLGDHSLAARTAWPKYMYEFEDLVAQGNAKMLDANGNEIDMGENELQRTMRLQNRTRVSPDMGEISRALDVCYWPAKFLGQQHPQLCEAVNAVAMAHSLGFDAGWVTRKRGGYADTWRQRHDQGCAINRKNPDAILVSAWWVRNREIAAAVAKAARNDVGPWLDALIQTEAQARGSVAVAHASAMERIRSAGAQIDAAVEAANGRGELAWFNRAYRAYREAGGRLAYQAARARLRRAVVRRLVITGGIEFGADLLPEVLGDGAVR
jgi:hypothetical protein